MNIEILKDKQKFEEKNRKRSMRNNIKTVRSNDERGRQAHDL
jgi:hypothetical protein